MRKQGKGPRLRPAYVGGMWHLVPKEELLSVLESLLRDRQISGLRKASLMYLRTLIAQTWDR